MVDSPVRWISTARSGQARAGTLVTPHGSVATPCFMAVGTLGALKGVTVEQARGVGQGVLLANTYHLALRPGPEVVHELGGLHAFCGWPGPMLTDSGGYQVFSLARNRVISETGVRFRSHLDGAPMLLTPEESIRIQRLLGADIIMAFDECPAADAGRDYAATSMALTLRWLDRSIAAWREPDGPGGATSQALYGIVQGGMFPDLRLESAAATAERDLPGIAIGGLAVGEERSQRNAILDGLMPHLPNDRPRYLMGVGTPSDLLDAVERGVDQFDCVLPTRMGRHGIAYTDDGPLHLKRRQYATDRTPLDPDTPSPAAGLSRGYLRHLIRAGEPLAGVLLSIHNLAYYNRFMSRIRAAICDGELAGFARRWRAQHDPIAPAGEHEQREAACPEAPGA
ncbi:MAG: tRNA guanosine(34) transglycosylase Tgt [Planctomycetota bacterium]